MIRRAVDWQGVALISDSIGARCRKIETRIPDFTPSIVRAYAIDDQALMFAMINKNYLIDLFLGLTAFRLHGYLKASLETNESVEINELYIALDRRDCRYAIPVVSMESAETFDISRIAGCFAFVRQKLRRMRCIPLAARLVDKHRVALSEFRRDLGNVRFVAEKRFVLMPPNPIDEEDYSAYDQQAFELLERRRIVGRI